MLKIININLLTSCLVFVTSPKACREIYERLVAKGKSKKLALIAVANKLLKQAFAIVKNLVDLMMRTLFRN